MCPFHDKKHIVQCRAPAFGPLSPSGCQGRPFWDKCVVHPLAWKIMVSVEDLQKIAQTLRLAAEAVENDAVA